MQRQGISPWEKGRCSLSFFAFTAVRVAVWQACERAEKKGKGFLKLGNNRKKKQGNFSKDSFFCILNDKKAKMKKFFRILNMVAPVLVHMRKENFLE